MIMIMIIIIVFSSSATSSSGKGNVTYENTKALYVRWDSETALCGAGALPRQSEEIKPGRLPPSLCSAVGGEKSGNGCFTSLSLLAAVYFSLLGNTTASFIGDLSPSTNDHG